MLHGFPECCTRGALRCARFQSTSIATCPRCRGQGETDAPRAKLNYTLDQLVGDVAKLVATLGRKRAIVVGHDQAAARMGDSADGPEIVERLVVMNCPHLRRFSEELQS